MTSTPSYACGTTDVPLLGLTVGDMLDRSAGRWPEHEALVVRHQGLRYTYRAFREAVDLCARGLLALGLRRGERLAVLSPNNAEWAVLQFATAKVGAVLVNINPSYRVHELEYALRQSGSRALAIAARFKTSDYLEMLAEIAPEIARCPPGGLSAARLPELRTVVRIGDGVLPGTFGWDELGALAGRVGAGELAARGRELQFDDPINIQYTSGTTGFPKGATLTHHNIVNNGFFVGEVMRLTDRDRLVIPVPLYHCFGMVLGNLACVTHGATAVYPSEGFDAAAVLEAVAEERATALHGVPTMFIAELEHPDFARYDMSSLRTGIMAGSPCPAEVMRQVIERMNMREVTICYGMTETSPVSTQTRADAPLDKRVGTVGRVHPHVEVKIVAPETGAVVARGEPGELCTRGYGVMLGYWDDREATEAAVDAARWMHTGDLAVMDEEGYVRIVGRIKDMVIRGGEKVFPREVEEFLHTHPKVVDVQVIGVPDAKYGEEVMAWVKVREGEAVTAEELRAFCRGRIAHFKVPRYVKFVDAFPMTVTGKVKKYEMREQSARELAGGEAS
jgi:fatty-acyl-CoA synthase